MPFSSLSKPFQALSKRLVLYYCISLLELLAVFFLGTFLIAAMIVQVGFGAASFSVLPVTYIGWRKGRWAGVLAGALISTTLFRMTVSLGGDASDFTAGGFGPGFIALSILGFLVGYARYRATLSQREAQIAELTSDALKLITADLSIAETLGRLTLRTEQDLPEASCSILTFDSEKGVLQHASAPSLPVSYCEAIDGMEIGPTAGSCGTAAFRNDIVIVSDTQSDPLWVDFAELAKEAGLRACWSIPIRDASNRVLGTFATYYKTRRSPQHKELKLVQEAADLMSIALVRRQDRERQAFLEDQVQLSQKLEGLGLLAGGIAHDFNNLLMGVMGNAELLMLNLEEEENSGRARNIIKAAEKAADLAKQMLVYAGKGSQQVSDIELSAHILDLNSLAKAAVPKNIRLIMNLSDNLPSLRADSVQLQQVFMNLITNAAEAIGDKEGSITVSTGCDYFSKEILPRALFGSDLQAGKYLSLQVSDTGPGISEEQMAHIFDPFYSTKFKGHGLGLAVVFGSVKNLNGAILLDSNTEVGTSFTILLPPSGERKPEKSGKTKPLPLSRPVDGGTALVIDDESEVRQIAAEYLGQLGFSEVLVASNGVEGIEKFYQRAAEVSLVLVDLTMPDMSGWELLDEITQRDSLAQFILMTGYDPEEVLRKRGSREFPVLNKPFNLASLSGLIS